MSAAPFRATRLTIAQVIGPHEMLDVLAAAEAADMEARNARNRASEAVGRFSEQRTYRMHLTPQEARRIATIEAGNIAAHRRTA